jgi:hypothetical protein
MTLSRARRSAKELQVEKESRVTFQDVEKLLHYDAATGNLIRKTDRRRFKAGTIAGSRTHCGHITTWINGEQFLGHRLAWLLHYGEWPSDQIDHINRNPADNRIENLRILHQLANMQNRNPATKSKTGIKGVYKANDGDAYYAQLFVNGAYVVRKRCRTIEEATRVIREAQKQYHPFFTVTGGVS